MHIYPVQRNGDNSWLFGRDFETEVMDEVAKYQAEYIKTQKQDRSSFRLVVTFQI
jgi:hypothetical protein